MVKALNKMATLYKDADDMSKGNANDVQNALSDVVTAMGGNAPTSLPGGAPIWNIVPAPPVPAVEEVRPGETLADTATELGLRVIPVTPEHVLRRQVHVAHIDHGSIRDLADQALRSFTGGQATPGEVTGVGALPLPRLLRPTDPAPRPLTRQQASLGEVRGVSAWPLPQWLRPTGTVARLLRLDGGGFAGFLNTITFPRLTRASRYALDRDGYVSPWLVREGGALTDTDGGCGSGTRSTTDGRWIGCRPTCTRRPTTSTRRSRRPRRPGRSRAACSAVRSSAPATGTRRLTRRRVTGT